MHVWRVSFEKFCNDQLKGLGGLSSSGRWHFEGSRIIYTSTTIALAAMEMLAYFDLDTAPSGLMWFEIDIPDDITVEICDPLNLTPRWQEYPYPSETQLFGTHWLIERRTCLLSVPSTHIPIERNILVNPEHVDISRIRVVNQEPFSYDPRLIKVK
ncbi:MAG: RES family NAD+ phosphorylase [Chloroflexi bacterium]|nr:RES family NAD+ phosphorylase [Chloroflexota bacterium]